MDLSNLRSRTPHGPLSPAERSYRMAQGLCMHCGQAGHFAPECPNRRSNTRSLHAAVTTAVYQPPVMYGALTSGSSPASSAVSSSGFPSVSSSGSGSSDLRFSFSSPFNIPHPRSQLSGNRDDLH